MDSCDAVVIGAGLAGLSAALELEAGGLSVRVLEAQQRVGGRVHSMRRHGATAEAGGTYIGAGYTRVIAAARRGGVTLIDVTPMLEFFREQDLVLDGELIRQSEWPAHPANPFPERDRELPPWQLHRVLTMRENPLERPEDWLDPRFADADVPARDWMRSLGLSERAIDVGYGMNPSFGESAADVSALLLFFRAAFSKAQRRLAPAGSVGFTAEGGVQRIPEAMADALRGGVELGREATAVLDRGGRVEVCCADGGRIDAAAAVCAVPPRVLAGMRIDPPLSGGHAALVSLPAQPITQVYLAPRSAFWERDGYAPSLYTDTVAGMVAAARNGDDPSQVTSLTAWAMGPAAARLDAMSEAEAGRAVIEAIERVRPAARGALELIGLKSWGTDPYALGAWAYFRPGEIRSAALAMAGPHGRIHFCGEHLARSCRGMEGAMESGERAAAEVLAG